MPATHVPGIRSPAPRSRALIVALGLVTCLIAGGAAASPVEARNWSQQIGAVRASQLYHESVMRAADLQLRSLKHAARRAHRQLKKSRRNVSQARARRNELRASRRALQVELASARTRWDALTAHPPTVAPPATWVAAGWPPFGTPADGIDDGRPELALVDALPLGVTPPEVMRTPAPPRAVGPLVDAASLEVRRLEAQVKHQLRALTKISRKVRRISRSHRAKARAVASVRASKRSAVARRDSAEAGLGNAILAMSSLAQRRIVKKTSVRPGRSSSFAWPTYGRITQGYGCTGYPLNPARGGCPHFHDGIDISGYRGTPIRAAAVGVVSYIGWNPWDQHGRAFMIVVAHPGGYETLYGHVLPTRRVRVGQLVRRGEVIGYMGSTGRSTGVHLHLEFRRGRTTLDPLAFL